MRRFKQADITSGVEVAALLADDASAAAAGALSTIAAADGAGAGAGDGAGAVTIAGAGAESAEGPRSAAAVISGVVVVIAAAGVVVVIVAAAVAATEFGEALALSISCTSVFPAAFPICTSHLRQINATKQDQIKIKGGKSARGSLKIIKVLCKSRHEIFFLVIHAPSFDWSVGLCGLPGDSRSASRTRTWSPSFSWLRAQHQGASCCA